MKTLIPWKKLTLSAAIFALLAGCSASKTTDEMVNSTKQAAEQETKQDETTVAQQPQTEPKAQPKPQPEPQPNLQQGQDAAQTAKDKMYDKYQTPPIMPTIQKPIAATERMAVSGSRMMRKESAMAGMSAPGYATQPMILGDQMYNHENQNHENYADTEGKLNPVYLTGQNPVSTFSIDVDTASYTNIRRLLNQGHLPQKGAVRVEEMINYFNYDYAAPESTEQPFAVHTEVAPSPWNPGTHLMRIALKGYQTSKENLPPMNLVFLFDVSGSMSNANKLPLVKQAFSLLTRQLRPQDHVSIVVYAGASGLVLKPTTGDKQAEILAALNQLNAGGSTNGGAGIQLAYSTAKANFNKNGINRVILATDGDFNVGTTNMSQLKSLIEQQKQSGVFLSILGLGHGNYNDHLMEELSNKGNGTAYYIDSFKEARKVFADGLTGTLQTIAKDVKIQVEFNPSQVSEYRLIGYDNRQLKREDFNNDKVDAGDIGSGHTVTAFYEVVLKGSNYHFSDPLRYQKTNSQKQASTSASTNSDELAFVKLRYKQPAQKTSQLIKLPILASNKLNSFAQASNEFKFAAAVAGFGEKLRHSQYVNWPLAQIKQTAMAHVGKDTWGYRHEFVQLTANAQVLLPE